MSRESEILITKDACWIWLGPRHHLTNYGVTGLNGGKERYAHRAIWKEVYGPIPDGLQVLHHCDNPPCVNPYHLFLGTAADNAFDRHRKGRTACGENANNILSEKQVIEIKRLLLGNHKSIVEISKIYGMSYMAIYSIKTGKSWKHLWEANDDSF